ncbi:hypothetical protein [Paenibacillus sp. S28]|uniref:hypothetical protein n=1 Tax=Paenibacillus sp. S28 TaxID=2767463 RepID=UPI00190E19AA|nr:hypothetical protein [Paenibacillus sp. S28]MBJ9993531.1 hypothetical protein [Paenibacillus sp. S28]
MSIDEFQIIGWLQALGVWGILFSFVLSVIISILGVIPSIFLSGVNVILIVPSGLVTFLAAATSVPFYIFCIASLIGKMPSVAIETLIAHDILFWGNNKIRLVVSALLILLLFLLLKRPQSYRKEV